MRSINYVWISPVLLYLSLSLYINSYCTGNPDPFISLFPLVRDYMNYYDIIDNKLNRSNQIYKQTTFIAINSLPL